MEEQLNPLAVTHLLQHTLRSLCLSDSSQWVYAVFWRILPRNYPPPKWDSQGGVYDRSRGNRRNWILVWEDGFCNFAASTSEMNAAAAAAEYGNCASDHQYHHHQHYQGLQPELFFKMSHEIYNYGEGLIGKVAADHSHKWIHNEPNDQEINFLSAWHNSADSHPRTWEAQFQSGIKTIALIAVREGVIQLGAVHKVIEDLSYVVLLRKKLSYIESIPGVLLPHPSSSSSYPFKNYDASPYAALLPPAEAWHNSSSNFPNLPNHEYYSDHFAHHHPIKITPSMSSLEALLSKLPSVVPGAASASDHGHFAGTPHHYSSTTTSTRPMELMGVERVVVAKEECEEDDDDDRRGGRNGNGHDGETSGGGGAASLLPPYHHHGHHHYGSYHHHHDLNVSSSMNNSG